MAAVREWLDRTPETWSPPAPADLTSPYRFLFWLTRSQARRIAVGAALGTLWTVGLAVPPWVLSRVVDQGLVARDTEALIGWSMLLLAVAVLNALLGIARHRTSQHAEEQVEVGRTAGHRAEHVDVGIRGSPADAVEVAALGHQPVARLVAERAAAVRRHAHRSTDVRAQLEAGEAARHRDGGAARRPTGHA